MCYESNPQDGSEPVRVACPRGKRFIQNSIGYLSKIQRLDLRYLSDIKRKAIILTNLYIYWLELFKDRNCVFYHYKYKENFVSTIVSRSREFSGYLAECPIDTAVKYRFNKYLLGIIELFQ